MTGEGAPFGVDINTGGIADSFANFVWEPAVVKVSFFDCSVIYDDTGCIIYLIPLYLYNDPFVKIL